MIDLSTLNAVLSGMTESGAFQPIHLLNSVIFGFLGMVILAVAYVVIEKLTPFSIKKELIEDRNVAVAYLLGGVMIGLSIIIASVIVS